MERRSVGVESAVYSGARHRRKQRIHSTRLINTTIRQTTCQCWLMDGFKDAEELIAPFTFHFFLEDFAVFVKLTFVFNNSRKFQQKYIIITISCSTWDNETNIWSTSPDKEVKKTYSSSKTSLNGCLSAFKLHMKYTFASGCLSSDMSGHRFIILTFHSFIHDFSYSAN